MDENETWHVYAELEAQLCRANARAEAAEQHARELELDRDEWKQACVDGNTRFQRSEAERRAMSDCEHGFPDGFGCALRCGEIRAEETDPDAVREPATCAGHPHREGGCGPQCAGCIDDARAEARRAALEECRSPAAVIPEAAPKMGSRGPCCSHHIPLDRDCDSCRVWAAGLAPAIERDALKARATAAEAENAALRERFAASEADYAACAEAIGVVYEADGHATQPGPRDAVVEHIREAVRDAGRYHEAEGRSYELREKLAVATQGLQHIKAKTTNVMAMVWSEETLKKLGVE